MNIKNTLNIQSLKPSYGEVSIGADPYNFIVAITKFIASRNKSYKVNNVPRSEYAMRFLGLIESLGFQIDWLTSSTFILRAGKDITSDLTNAEALEKCEYKEFIYLLVPSLLLRFSEITISNQIYEKLDEELEFYESLDIKIFDHGKSGSKLAIPLSSEDVNAYFELYDYEWYQVASRLIFKDIYPNCKIVYDKYDSKIAGWELLKKDEHTCSPFFSEFFSYVVISILTDGEMFTHDYDLEKFLPFLLKLVDLGVNYEVADDRFQLWYEHKEFSTKIIYENMSMLELGFIFLVLNQYSDHSILIQVRKKDEYEDLVREFNIIGLRINYNEYTSEDDITYMQFSLKPQKIQNLKTSLNKNYADLSFLLLITGFLCKKSKVGSISSIENYIPEVRECLYNLNLDIAFE